MEIRTVGLGDTESIRCIYRSAFDEKERDLVSELAVDLLSEKTVPSTFSLIAESDGMAVGHIAFSPVTLQGDTNCIGYILAPLAVIPDSQHAGFGSALIERGVAILTAREAGVLLVYGDPNYYGRFGFSPEIAERYLPPYPLEHPFGWLGMIPGGIGEPGDTVRISCVDSLERPELW